jgi:LysR family pca operon transcriptional activator
MSIDQRIKFRHLQCFLEVARQGSVVKAADILGITQPAVSKTLKELEETLDVPLFDRTTRGARLTAFGEVFLRHAGASVAALRQGVDGIAQVRNRGGAVVKLGALPTVSATIIPRAIQMFKARATGATIHVVTGDNAVLLAALRVGELDLVVGRLASPEQMATLVFEHLYTEPVRFVVRPGHPLTRESGFALANILDYTVLMPSEDSIIRPLVDRLLIANGVGAIPDRIETVSMPFGRRYVRSSDAVWIISQGVVAEDIASGDLIELPVDTDITKGPVGLTTRADQPAGVALLMLMTAIREAVEE